MSDPSDLRHLENPYEAPQTSLAPPVAPLVAGTLFGEEAPETVRRRYLDREATVRTIGMLVMGFGVSLIINSCLSLWGSGLWEALATQAERNSIQPWIVQGGVLGFIGLCSASIIALGGQLRGLRGWSRWLVMILIVPILLFWARIFWTMSIIERAMSGQFIAIVAVIAAGLRIFILGSLVRSDSQLVCSGYYRSIVAETSEIRPKLGVRDMVMIGIFGIEVVAPLLRYFLW